MEPMLKFVCRSCGKVTAGRKARVKKERDQGSMFPRRHRYNGDRCHGIELPAKVVPIEETNGCRFLDPSPIARSGDMAYMCLDLGFGIFQCGACMVGRVLPNEKTCPECQATIER